MTAGTRTVDTQEVWPFIVGFSIIALAVGIALLFGVGSSPTAQGAILLANTAAVRNAIPPPK